MLPAIIANRQKTDSAVANETSAGGGRGMSKRTIAFFVFLAVLLAGGARPLLRTIDYVRTGELNSYTLLIPFVVAYLVYVRRDQLPRTGETSVVWAALPLLGGVCAGWASVAWPGLSSNAQASLVMLALVLLIIAGGFLFLGAKWMAQAAFPAAFLFFAIPMPNAMVDLLETGSKLGSTEVADVFFRLTDTPVLRSGTFFSLPGITIEVAQECSGIRSSVVLLITSVLAANLFLRNNWHRAILVAAVIPLGLLRNGFRILVVSLLCVHIGPHMINSPIHRRGGPIFFALALIPLFLLLWGLWRAEKRKRQTETASIHG